MIYGTSKLIAEPFALEWATESSVRESVRWLKRIHMFLLKDSIILNHSNLKKKKDFCSSWLQFFLGLALNPSMIYIFVFPQTELEL